MRIEIDFDERSFPEPVWDALYLNAKALRHVLGGTLEHVRVSTRRHHLNGEDARFVEFAITLGLPSGSVTKAIEFGPHGYWRLERFVTSHEEDVFHVFRPDARFEYERDLINRPELRLDILYVELLRWLEELAASQAAIAGVTQPLIQRLRRSTEQAARVWQTPAS